MLEMFHLKSLMAYRMAEMVFITYETYLAISIE